MAKITITKTKGEFLNLLKGLFSVLHIKGKDFSFTVRDNILVIKEALSGYIFDVQIKAIKLANPEAVQERETQLQELEVALDISISLELDTLSRSILTEEITADNLLSINEFIED